MLVQSLVVAVLVAACAGYAAWTLMPASLRRTVARALTKLPGLPRRFSLALEARSVAPSACACDGCDKGKSVDGAARAVTPISSIAPLVFHRRPPK